MPQVWIKVLAMRSLSRLRSISTKKRVSVGFDSWKRGRKQIGQGRPVMPVFAYGHLRKRQTKRQAWLEPFVERIRL